MGHGRLTDTEAKVAGLGVEMRWADREPDTTEVGPSAAYCLDDEEEEDAAAAADVEDDEDAVEDVDAVEEDDDRDMSDELIDEKEAVEE